MFCVVVYNVGGCRLCEARARGLDDIRHNDCVSVLVVNLDRQSGCWLPSVERQRDKKKREEEAHSETNS